MLRETLDQIDARIQAAQTLPPEKRAELAELVKTLRAEVSNLSETHADDARSITGFAAVSAHEATRPDQNPERLGHSLAGLSSAVEGFEASHPRLVQIVNSISTTLSNLGI